MKIGAFVPQGWRMDLNGVAQDKQWHTILEAANKIEKLNYESLWVYDHFHTVPKPTQDPTYECWTLMSALSQTTNKLRLGQMCTCNSYRNPAYLTKVASNIDVMSGGRLEYAIGAGWYDHEYKAYGYDYPTAGIRLKMLEESLIIYKLMTTEENPVFEGQFYKIDGAINQPKPLQKPYPPLWVCGGGDAGKKLFTLLDLCVSSLRRGHANLLCIVPILTDDPRRESNTILATLHLRLHMQPRPRTSYGLVACAWARADGIRTAKQKACVSATAQFVP